MHPDEISLSIFNSVSLCLYPRCTVGAVLYICQSTLAPKVTIIQTVFAQISVFINFLSDNRQQPGVKEEKGFEPNQQSRVMS